MKQRYWVTLSFPIEAESPQDALDMGWDALIADEPEGLVEHVCGTDRPVIQPDSLLEKAA